MTNIRVMIKAWQLTFCPVKVATSSIYHRETKLYYLIELVASTLAVWMLSICQGSKYFSGLVVCPLSVTEGVISMVCIWYWSWADIFEDT